MTDLVDEVRLSFHAFSEFARKTHGSRIDPPGRAVLEYLSKRRPSTVPEMARARGVSRQHIQSIVNGLESDGLVDASSNPAHKRSSLYALTPEGVELIGSIVAIEQALVDPLREVLDPDRLTAATNTLSEVRTLIAGLEPRP